MTETLFWTRTKGPRKFTKKEMSASDRAQRVRHQYVAWSECTQKVPIHLDRDRIRGLDLTLTFTGQKKSVNT